MNPTGFSHIVVDGFHSALYQVGLVPEAGASGVAQEVSSTRAR